MKNKTKKQDERIRCARCGSRYNDKNPTRRRRHEAGACKPREVAR